MPPERDINDRTISTAELYGLADDRFPSAPDLTEHFERADDGGSIEPPMQAQFGEGSQQVGETGSRHETRPPEELARDPDRQAHEARMERDDQAAKDDQMLDAYLESLEAHEHQIGDNTLDHDRGLG